MITIYPSFPKNGKLTLVLKNNKKIVIQYPKKGKNMV